MSACHRVVLVEDDATICRVIELLLSLEPGFELVGTAATAEEAIEQVARLAPDVVLLDNHLAGPMTGVQAAPRLKQAAPSAIVLLCTALDLASVAAAEPAIDGYLRKDELALLVDKLVALLPGSV